MILGSLEEGRQGGVGGLSSIPGGPAVLIAAIENEKELTG
jgi:hypothetical protein